MEKDWDFGKKSDFRKMKREPDIRFSYFIFYVRNLLCVHSGFTAFQPTARPPGQPVPQIVILSVGYFPEIQITAVTNNL